MSLFQTTRFEHIVIRELSIADVDRFQAYHQHPEYLAHYSTPPNANDIVNAAREWSEQVPRQNYQLAICTLEAQFIGSLGVRREGYAADEGEIGIEIDPAFWGKGYARGAIRFGIHLADKLSVSRLHALTKPTNARAINLFESIGFKRQQTDDDVLQLSFQIHSA